MQLPVNISFVELQAPADVDGGVTCDYFSMKNYGRAAIFIQFGAVASGANDLTVTLMEATSVAGAGAQALDVPRAYKYDAATDIYTEVTVETDGTVDCEANSIYVIDITETELTVNSDYDCLSVILADPGVSAMCAVNAILYNAKMVKTALTN